MLHDRVGSGTNAELGLLRDFLCLDSTCHPLTKAASFRSCTADSFRDEDQRDLADLFRQLTEKSCLCMLSNSYTPFILELYKSFRIETVEGSRAMNCDGAGRGGVQEVVEVSY